MNITSCVQNTLEMLEYWIDNCTSSYRELGMIADAFCHNQSLSIVELCKT